jgi:hypothetical protein
VGLECGDETMTKKASIEEIVAKLEAGEELTAIEVAKLCRNKDSVKPELHERIDELCRDEGRAVAQRKDLKGMSDEERREHFRGLRRKNKK